MIARLLISKEPQSRINEVTRILTQENLSLNHPDLLYFPEGSKLGIESARQIKEHFSLKPYSAKGRVVVLEDASALTPEAQNALLKTLEEPPEYALILLGAPSEDTLLPTVLSRCQTIYLSKQNPRSHRTPTSEVGYNGDIQKLLGSSFDERFEYIEKLKERGEFLQALIVFWRNRLHLVTKNAAIDNKVINEVRNFLHELLRAEKWAKQNVNIRAILEYLMLVMSKND